ncbi:unnamed protein product [Ilex paraguariensis]|uniref:Uncharacterized protein n=1 Tax=Ilex paraguariensis TaxID=185542 RepID=A0ABC8THS0_9AQUA
MVSSSAGEHESSSHSRRDKQHDRTKKKKDKQKGKSRRHKHQKHIDKEKQQHEGSGSPVQLSKFLQHDQDDGVRRSAVSGKKKYEKVALGVHFSLSTVPNQETMVPMEKRKNRTVELVALSGGALALAVLLNKVFFSVRVPITLVLTPPN